jgi:hypothetical protein
MRPASPVPEQLDPVERWIPLLAKCALYALLSFLFYEAAVAFREYVPLQPWPFFLSMFRMFTFLPIHEAGHLIFSLFGRTLHILGGSFWQVMFMLIWFVIALRQRSQTAPIAAFFIGENMMDVSLYVRDAQYMALPLLGGDSTGHDWKNLLVSWDALSSAEAIADLLYYSGWIIAAGSLAFGIGLAISRFLHPPLAVSLPSPIHGRGDSLPNALATRIDAEELDRWK